MAFPKGHKFSPGGTKGNAGGGRKPDWLKDQCRSIVKDKKLIKFLGDVASGEPFVEKTSVIEGENKGITIEKMVHSAEVKDRLRAVEMLLDRGWGKAPQSFADGDGNKITPAVLIIPMQDRGERGKIE